MMLDAASVMNPTSAKRAIRSKAISSFERCAYHSGGRPSEMFGSGKSAFATTRSGVVSHEHYSLGVMVPGPR